MEQSSTPVDDPLNARQQQLLKFITAKKDYLILAFILFIGIFIRSRNLNLLRDVTTGNYISLELDSTLFYRYAQYIADHGTLFSIDTFRNYPLGAHMDIGIFTSYFVAYLYKILHIFIPTITVEYVDIIYPIVATAILTSFLFLLVRRLFNFKVALLAATFVNLMPAFLFRSLGGSSDHDILGIMFLFIAFYFYAAGWQSSRKKYNILFGALAGLATILGFATAGSAAFIPLTIGVFSLIELFFDKFGKNDSILLLTYTIALTLLWPLIVQRPYAILFGSLSTGVIYLALLTTLARSALRNQRFTSYFHKIPFISYLPLGIQAFALSFSFLFFLILLVFGPAYIYDKFAQITNEVFKTTTRFAVNRWIVTVAENKRPYVTDWFGQYGQFFVYTFIIGSIMLFSKMVRHMRRARHFTALYALFIFGYIFSRYSANSVLNGDSPLAKQVFYGSSILFFGVVAALYFYEHYKKTDVHDKVKSIDRKYAFVFIWFFLKVLAATSAIRLLFEFSPIIAILSAFFFITLYEFVLTIKDKYIKWAALAFLFLILFSPFSFAQGILMNQYQSSLAQARGSGPGYNQQWQYAGKWVRENTPENAVFAHWWDYGYWVQSGFQRPTITDGGNFIAWWNYLMGRHVLTAQNDTEPLKFLYAHNTSYLLMVQDEIGKYGAYSSIGADVNYDRFSFIPTFQLNPQATEEKRNVTVLTYQGGFGLDENLVINDKVYPQGQAGIGAVFVPIEQLSLQEGGSSARIHQPTVALVYQNQRVDLPLQCLYFNNQQYLFENYSVPGCLRIIPIISGNQLNPLGAALYLSRRTYASLFAKLYLLNQPSDYFHLAYDDSQQVPLAIYNGRTIGPIKIWKVTYPPNIALTSDDTKYYLGTDYVDPQLTKL